MDAAATNSVVSMRARKSSDRRSDLEVVARGVDESSFYTNVENDDNGRRVSFFYCFFLFYLKRKMLFV